MFALTYPPWLAYLSADALTFEGMRRPSLGQWRCVPRGLPTSNHFTYDARARTRTGAQETRMTTAPHPSRSRLRGFLLSRSSPLGLRSPAPSNADRIINVPRSHGMSLTAPVIDLPDTDG